MQNHAVLFIHYYVNSNFLVKYEASLQNRVYMKGLEN